MQYVSATAQHDVSVITGGLQTSLYLSKKENCIQTQESEAERERPRERSRKIRLEKKSLAKRTVKTSL